GTPAYTYNWSPNGETTTAISGLMQGTYTVSAADINNCSATKTVAITQPNALLATVSSQINVSCNGGNNGSASVSVNPSGGTAPYTYLWNNGQTTSVAVALAAGNYTATVTDANNCTPSTATVAITQP